MKKTERKTKRPAANVDARVMNCGLDEIKELIELVAEKQFTEFELERGGFRLRLARGGAPQAPATPFDAARRSKRHSGRHRDRRRSHAAALAAVPAPPEEALHLVTSPIVGTFYRSPSPTAEPFVEVGDRVAVGTDALHHRGDEAHERDPVGCRRRDRQNLRRKRPAGRVRPAAVRYQDVGDRINSEGHTDAGHRESLIRSTVRLIAVSPLCSKKSSLPTAARSPVESSGRARNSTSRRSRSTPRPTAMPCTCASPTKPICIGPAPPRKAI